MSPTTMTARETYLGHLEREYQTTRRLLEAYPADQSELRPAEKSKNARELAFMLALGHAVPGVVGTTDALLAPPPMEAPPTWGAVLGMLQQVHADTMAKLGALTDADFDATFTLASGPGGQTTTMRRIDALWFFLMDHVHHRGQFSVYARIAGAKVPAIYGPSADEPWS